MAVQEGVSAVHMAAYNGHLDVVTALMQHSANVEIRALVRPEQRCTALLLVPQNLIVSAWYQRIVCRPLLHWHVVSRGKRGCCSQCK